MQLNCSSSWTTQGCRRLANSQPEKSFCIEFNCAFIKDEKSSIANWYHIFFLLMIVLSHSSQLSPFCFFPCHKDYEVEKAIRHNYQHSQTSSILDSHIYFACAESQKLPYFLLAWSTWKLQSNINIVYAMIYFLIWLLWTMANGRNKVEFLFFM